MTLEPSADIPRIIEGIDPFDDQTASAQFLEEEQEVDEKKKELIREIYALIREKAPDITPTEAYEIFVFKFGVSLSQMNGMGLFEAKKWVENVEARPPIVEKEQKIESSDHL